MLTQFCGWRTIFWLQTALAGTGAVLVVFGLPETSHHKKIDDLEGMSRARKTKRLLVAMSPTRVITLFRVPNLIVAALASSALVWNMYSLLVSLIVNPSAFAVAYRPLDTNSARSQCPIWVKLACEVRPILSRAWCWLCPWNLLWRTMGRSYRQEVYQEARRTCG